MRNTSTIDCLRHAGRYLQKRDGNSFARRLFWEKNPAIGRGSNWNRDKPSGFNLVSKAGYRQPAPPVVPVQTVRAYYLKKRRRLRNGHSLAELPPKMWDRSRGP